jgi:hypothetical protein
MPFGRITSTGPDDFKRRGDGPAALDDVRNRPCLFNCPRRHLTRRPAPVVGVVEMIRRKLVTLIVPSLVLDEFRRLGWVRPVATSR